MHQNTAQNSKHYDYEHYDISPPTWQPEAQLIACEHSFHGCQSVFVRLILTFVFQTLSRRVLSSNSVLNILPRPLSKTKLAAGAMPPAARPELLRADLKGWLFKLTKGVSIDGYSTYRATRFSEPV